MVRNNQGLTKTYNRFHDPDERSPDILKLRELHAAMDRAVLDAYGWADLKPTCEFLLDYEEDEDEDESGGGGRRRKKPQALTAGPMNSATKSWPSSSSSTANAAEEAATQRSRRRHEYEPYEPEAPASEFQEFQGKEANNTITRSSTKPV